MVDISPLLIELHCQTRREDTVIVKQTASAWKQFGIVLRRAWLSQWRDVKYNVARLLVVVFMYLLFGLIFQDLDRTNFATIQVRRSSCL